MGDILRLAINGLQTSLSLEVQILCCLLKELSHLLKIRQGTQLTITQKAYAGKFLFRVSQDSRSQGVCVCVGGGYGFFTLYYLLSKYAIIIWLCFFLKKFF